MKQLHESEMPFASLSVDGRQLAAGRKVEAEHDKVIKYLLLAANPDMKSEELNRLMELARDLIAKTHLSEFGNYYLPYLKDAEAAMKAGLKTSDKKEESLTQGVNDLKALLAEAETPEIVVSKSTASGGMIHFVAMHGEEQAGYLNIYQIRGGYAHLRGNFSQEQYDKMFPDNRYLKVELLSVDREYRRHGVGTMLMDAAIKYADESGWKEMYLEASPLDTQGLPLDELAHYYEKFGFKPVLRKDDNVFMLRKGEGGQAPVQEDDNLFNQIQHGSRVTILTPHGSKLTGRAVMYNQKDGFWILNLGGAYGTPGLASPENVIAVRGGLKEEKNFSINKWSGKK